MCDRFQPCPKEFYLKAVKRIFKYLHDTKFLGFWYPKETLFDLMSYSDTDLTGSQIDRISITNTCYFLGHKLVLWILRKQNLVVLSTTKVEYIVVVVAPKPCRFNKPFEIMRLAYPKLQSCVIT